MNHTKLVILTFCCLLFLVKKSKAQSIDIIIENFRQKQFELKEFKNPEINRFFKTDSQYILVPKKNNEYLLLKSKIDSMPIQGTKNNPFMPIKKLETNSNMPCRKIE